jgi:hypothetical protein
MRETEMRQFGRTSDVVRNNASTSHDRFFANERSFPFFAGETRQREWCTLAYWELSGRVGRLYPVEPSTVNVFDSLHDGDGLCLATLAENHNAPPAVQRTRSKIGLGKSPCDR